MSAPTEDRPDDGAPLDPLQRLLELDLELPPTGTGARTARPPRVEPPAATARTGPSRRWMAVFCTLLVGSLVAAAALAFVGIQTVRDSRAGRSVSSVTDPAAPGFEAFVEPTPTLGILHQGPEGLVSAAVLAINPGGSGGSVLVVPPLSPTTDEPDAVSISFVATYAQEPATGGIALQSALGIGIGEVVLVDDARWAELVEPVAPLRFENPDALPGFPAGPVALGPDDVGPWLAARAEGEEDLARMFRHQLFWEAWAAAVGASSDLAAVPGEVDAGLGRFVRALAGGPLQVATWPVVQTVDAEGATRFQVDEDAAADVIARLIPFPTAAREGERARVRLLDGTGEADHVARVAPRIVPAGSQIVVAGNADRFDYEQTEIRYHAPEGRPVAERLRAALGVGTVVEDVRPIDAFDVTIVLGTDL